MLVKNGRNLNGETECVSHANTASGPSRTTPTSNKTFEGFSGSTPFQLPTPSASPVRSSFRRAPASSSSTPQPNTLKRKRANYEESGDEDGDGDRHHVQGDVHHNGPLNNELEHDNEPEPAPANEAENPNHQNEAPANENNGAAENQDDDEINSDGEPELEDGDPVEMRVRDPNLIALADDNCKRNAKKAKRQKVQAVYIASGEGIQVQEPLPAAVLALAVQDGVDDNDFRRGIRAISESIRGGSFEEEAQRMVQRDDLVSIVGRVCRMEENSVVFRFTQLLNKLQLALKINR